MNDDIYIRLGVNILLSVLAILMGIQIFKGLILFYDYTSLC
jgi:hypothetical protein